MNPQNAVKVTDQTAKPDVLDTERYEKFCQKREEWISWLGGKDLHAISNQISALLSDYTLFLTLNDLWKDAAQNPVVGVGFNGPVVRLLVSGFVATQATGIRRLTEKQWKDAMKRVLSLRALVDDVKASRELLTREVYLACHGLPYNFEPGKEAHFNELAAAEDAFFFGGLDTSGPNAWSVSVMAHDRFDKLSETSPTGRSREDLVSLKWFDRLDSKLKSCENVCVFADKFIAHAADLTSRSRLTTAQEGITLARLGECHQALIQVTEFVGCRILQCYAGASVPAPQFDPVENLDKAWATARDKASEFWEHNWESVKQ